MADKIDPYDILTKLVLGILLLCALPVGFPVLPAISSPRYPTAFEALALTAAALFIGELLQALSSVLEGYLYKTFGGRPSDYALEKGVGRLSQTAALRIRTKLEKAVGKASTKDLFQYARQIAQTQGRVPKFNAQYGYHRGMYFLVLFIFFVFLASAQWGAAAALDRKATLAAVGFFLLLLALVWKRTKQWAFYYTEEILLTAEQILDKHPPAAPEADEEATGESSEPDEEIADAKTEDEDKPNH